MVINGVLFARLSHPRCTSSHLWPWLDVDTWASSTEGSHMAKLRSKLVDGSAVRYSIFEPWPWILWCVSSFGFFSKKAQEWDGWRFTKSNLWLTEPWFWPIAILHKFGSWDKTWTMIMPTVDLKSLTDPVFQVGDLPQKSDPLHPMASKNNP